MLLVRNQVAPRGNAPPRRSATSGAYPLPAPGPTPTRPGCVPRDTPARHTARRAAHVVMCAHGWFKGWLSFSTHQTPGRRTNRHGEGGAREGGGRGGGEGGGDGGGGGEGEGGEGEGGEDGGARARAAALRPIAPQSGIVPFFKFFIHTAQLPFPPSARRSCTMVRANTSHTQR